MHDSKWDSTVNADVTVTVRLLPREAVTQSGSLRVRGLTAEEFVTPEDENVSRGVGVSRNVALREVVRTCHEDVVVSRHR